MKKLLVAVMVVVATAHFGIAGEPTKKFTFEEKRIELAKKNIAVGLQSENTGLMESAIRMTAQLKMKYPATDISALVTMLNKISVTHPIGKIRYTAYVSSIICSDPHWFLSDDSVAHASDESFFRVASGRLQQKFFSASAL